MIGAAIDTPLFAITHSGGLFRIRSEHSNIWERVNISGVEEVRFIDLRDNRSVGPVTVTTDDGRVFRFNHKQGWSQS